MLGIIYEYDLHPDTLHAIFLMVGIPWVNHVLSVTHGSVWYWFQSRLLMELLLRDFYSLLKSVCECTCIFREILSLMDRLRVNVRVCAPRPRGVLWIRLIVNSRKQT